MNKKRIVSMAMVILSPSQLTQTMDDPRPSHESCSILEAKGHTIIRRRWPDGTVTETVVPSPRFIQPIASVDTDDMQAENMSKIP